MEILKRYVYLQAENDKRFIVILFQVPRFFRGHFFWKKETKGLWEWKKGVIFAPALGRKGLGAKEKSSIDILD